MNIKSLSILFISTILFYGCASTSTYPTAVEYASEQDSQPIEYSLFESKDQTISEENIQRILNGEIKIPDTVRIAVFKYASASTNKYYSYYWNDEEYLKTQQSYIDTLISQLKNSTRIKKIITVPSLMTGDQPNMIQLRETAVRLQADLLLVFTINSDIYYKYKTFQKNEAKAYATIETLLMDTRTGVVPHTSIVTQEMHIQKAEEDWTNEETRKRAENGAIFKSLIVTGKKVYGFLEE